LTLVIFVFSSDNSNPNSSFRNFLTLFIIDAHSSLDPLIPMIQSSAYLTYSNFLKLGSMFNLDGVFKISL
jgi:hypothetical protein